MKKIIALTVIVVFAVSLSAQTNIRANNGTFTGTVTAATANADSTNGIINIGKTYLCNTAGFTAALAALPSTGGTVNARACGNVTLSSTITLSTSATQPVTLILPSGFITFTNTSGHGFVINGNGDQLIGEGPLNSQIGCGAGFTGDIVHAEPNTVGWNSISGLNVTGFRIDQSGCSSTAARGMGVLSIRNPSHFWNLEFRYGLAKAVEIGLSGNAGAVLSQGVHLEDVYVESNTGAGLLADLVKVECNQCYLGPNVVIIGDATPNSFYLLHFASTQSVAVPRGNVLIAGAVAYSAVDTTHTCIAMDSVTGAGNTAAQGNQIIGNTIEQCGIGVLLTGPNSGLAAFDNWVTANYYLASTIQVKADFASTNRIEEITNGNAGAITLTANSTNNLVNIRYGNVLADVSDAGTANTIQGAFNLGGTPAFFRNGTVQLASTGVFKISTDTGLSRVGAGQIGVGNGTAGDMSGFIYASTHRVLNNLRLETDLLRFGSGAVIGWSANANGESNAADSGISRTGVATTCAGNGTQGNCSGTFNAANFNGIMGATTPAAGSFTTVSATGQITSTLTTGTAPFSITSTTVVPNLNVSQLLGNTWAVPGTIGSTTPNTGAFTSLAAGSAKFNINTNGLPTLSNNVTLAGQGYPLIVGITSQKNETTSADANVLTVTPASVAGSYRLCTVISVSAATSGVIGWTATWTDSNGNAQTPVELELFQNATAGPALTFTTSSASNYHSCVTIDVNGAGTNIVIKWIGGGTTTAKMTAWVERII